MTVRHIVQDLKVLTDLLNENPHLLSNIEVVYFSCTLSIYREEKVERVKFVKKSFAVTTTFHLSLESQIEAYLCQTYQVDKFITPVKINGSSTRL